MFIEFNHNGKDYGFDVEPIVWNIITPCGLTVYQLGETAFDRDNAQPINECMARDLGEYFEQDDEEYNVYMMEDYYAGWFHAKHYQQHYMKVDATTNKLYINDEPIVWLGVVA